MLTWYQIARERFNFMRRMGLKGTYFSYRGKFKTIPDLRIIYPEANNDNAFPYSV